MELGLSLEYLIVRERPAAMFEWRLVGAVWFDARHGLNTRTLLVLLSLPIRL